MQTGPGKFKLILGFIIDMGKITSQLRLFERQTWSSHERTDHKLDNDGAATIVPTVAA